VEGVKEVDMKGTGWLTITGWTDLVDLSVTSPTGHTAMVYISWQISYQESKVTDTSKATIIPIRIK
jgi:hypothetical protein